MTLQAYYPLDEDSGSTAYDYSGNENHGSITGAGPAATGTVAGPLGASAYDFDGSDDLVDLDRPFTFGNTGWSAGMWLKMDSFSASNQTFFGWGDGNFNEWFQWRFSDFDSDSNNTDLQINFDDGTSNNSLQFMDTRWSDNNWHHIWVSHVEGTGYKVYFDGVFQDTIAENGSLADSDGTANKLYIGQNDSGGQHSNCAITDVRIYDRALSPVEVAYLYEVSQGGSYVSETKTL